MNDELYKVHRPVAFKQVIGQPEAVEVLNKLGKTKSIPHAILFSGPSGCGKTTLARILRKKLKCHDADFTELNSADFRGIDMVRGIRAKVGMAPMASPCRVWMIDEVHQLTTAAQDAFLKLLEDTPGHVYFFLCTTDPQKLKKTIRTRCTDIRVRELKIPEITQLLLNVAEEEEATLPEAVADRIAELAEGSARRALVLLHSVIHIEDEDEQLDALQRVDVEGEAIKIARALMKKKPNWKEVANLLKATKEDPEQLRWMVLGYAKSVLLNGANPRAYLMIEAFRDNFYDSKMAGLVAACYEVVHGGN